MKTLLMFVLAGTLLLSCKKEPGKVSGVITYYFNENFGNKPDVGSKIYFLSANDVDTNQFI